jgi:hypothetical protein
MDPNTVVSEQTESGRRLIEALIAVGFDVQLAFWAKPAEEGKWYLYLASPFVDGKGPAAAYRLVLDLLRKMPQIGMDPFEIKVLGLNDSLTQAVLARIDPQFPASAFASRSLEPYGRMTWLGVSTLGGVSMDGAYVYPSAPPAASV